MSAASIRSSSISHGELAPASLGAGDGEGRLGEHLGWLDCWGELFTPRVPGEGLTFPEPKPGLVRPTPAGATPSLASSTTRFGDGWMGVTGAPTVALEEAVRLLARLGASPQSMTSSFSGLLASLRGLARLGKGRLLTLHTGLAPTVLAPPTPPPPLLPPLRSSVSSQD